MLTFFTGYEFTPNTIAYLDVEEAGGRGLSSALGLAGFTNLDVVRNPTLGAQPYIARLMIQQIIPFSKETMEVERDRTVTTRPGPRAQVGNPVWEVLAGRFLRRERRRLRQSLSVSELGHGEQRRLGLRCRHSRLYRGSDVRLRRLQLGPAICRSFDAEGCQRT